MSGERGKEMKPRLLDLFCGAGGAAKGYADAGFDVVGVDINPQPHYPYAFIQGDAIDVLSRLLQGESILASDRKLYRIEDFDAIHASPPCQRYSRITKWTGKNDHPDLLQPTIDALKKTGKLFVVENVADAPMTNYLMLCGTMFGLKVMRHRHFICNPPILMAYATCNHYSYSVNSVRGADRSKYKNGEFMTVTGHISNPDRAKKAMGIDWMSTKELVQAIPPAYTEYIGKQLLNVLQAQS
jgi:DNA (cytosine-5)-methyltransferase 1